MSAPSAGRSRPLSVKQGVAWLCWDLRWGRKPNCCCSTKACLCAFLLVGFLLTLSRCFFSVAVAQTLDLCVTLDTPFLDMLNHTGNSHAAHCLPSVNDAVAAPSVTRCCPCLISTVPSAVGAERKMPEIRGSGNACGYQGLEWRIFVRRRLAFHASGRLKTLHVMRFIDMHGMQALYNVLVHQHVEDCARAQSS
jgi:hypothetical protein